MDIRILDRDDAEAYRNLRLRALREDPEAFGARYEDEVRRTVEQVAEALGRTTPESHTLGAWEVGNLAGLLYFFRRDGHASHRAGIGAMFVAPERRGRGLGGALLDEALGRARALEGVEEVTLAVTAGNGAARNLYVSRGFATDFIDRGAVKIGDRYLDLEWMRLRL